jgi:hypothetical protein
VAIDGSLKTNGAMGAAFVAKDSRLAERSVAVLGPPSSIRPELTGIALALEACPQEEELTILTDCLSAMRSRVHIGETSLCGSTGILSDIL